MLRAGAPVEVLIRRVCGIPVAAPRAGRLRHAHRDVVFARGVRSRDAGCRCADGIAFTTYLVYVHLAVIDALCERCLVSDGVTTALAALALGARERRRPRLTEWHVGGSSLIARDRRRGRSPNRFVCRLALGAVEARLIAAGPSPSSCSWFPGCFKEADQFADRVVTVSRVP